MNLDFLSDLPAPRHSHTYRGPPLPPLPTMHHHYSSFDWRSQAPQSALFGGALAPSSWTNAGPSNPPPSLWPAGPPDFLLPFHHYSTRPFDGTRCSVARSDTSSAVSRDSDLSPSPEVAQVVCNAPLVAPIPLPYHSPTFLLYDLPDDDEDLSHPPYTHRPHKRKRARDEDSEEETSSQDAVYPRPVKRRAVGESSQHWNPSAGQWGSSAGPAAPISSLRHPAAAFSRRNRAR